ncbi:MAG: tocopherol cyclase family protein [Spirochaetales bacterium]
MADPFAFAGKKKRNYFEGWYCKNVAPGGHAYSFIPGVSYDAGGAAHAFVQVIRGSDGATAFERYPISEFRASAKTFDVTVGPNHFGFDGISLSLPEAFGGIEGSLAYEGITRLRGGLLTPWIMGWYRAVPFMECYHEVGSLSHEISGALDVAGSPIDFDGGRGYLEKDWGTSMPSAWIWMQCNGFATPGASLMISIARIPWLNGQFTGFLGFVRFPQTGAAKGARESGNARGAPGADERDGPPAAKDTGQSGNAAAGNNASESKTPGRFRQARFGTFSGAKILAFEVEGNKLRVTIEAGSLLLAFEAERSKSGTLAAPVGGAMERRIAESLDGRVELSVSEGGERLFVDRGSSAGIELVGVIDSLVRTPPT